MNRINWRQLIIAALAAGAAAAVVNVIYYAIAGPVDAPQPGPEGELVVQNVPLVAVGALSFIFLLIAAVVYGVTLFAVPERADVVYIVIAIVALLLSFRFPGNYFNPDFPANSRWILGATHVIAAVVGVAALIGVYRRT